jgi:hypothetical protein
MAGTRSKSKAKSEPRCRHCQAPNDLDAPECWLCQRRDWRGARDVLGPSFDPPLPRRNPFATVRGLPGAASVAGSGRSPDPTSTVATGLVLLWLFGLMKQVTGSTVGGVLLSVVAAVLGTILFRLQPTRGDRP